MTAKSHPKALVFDVFGTVVDWRNSIAEEAERLLAPRGVDVDWLEFADAWRGQYQPSMERIRSGGRSWQRLDVLHRENLLTVLKHYDIAIDEATDSAFIDDLNFAWHRLRGWPDAAEGIGRLKTKFVVGTLSNGNIALMVNLAKHAGLPWDVILGAEITRHYKPDPPAYLLTAEALGLPPQRCMLVAAHNSDLVAARQCGFQTAFVTRPTEHGASQQDDLRALHDFEYVATDFNDLADQLGCA